jgi:hypothetical protein
VRESGTTTANLLMDLWNGSSFVSDPPNSALVMRDGPASGMVVVKASRPKFKNGIIAFTVTPIESKSALPMLAESVSLFIDNFTPLNGSALVACLKNPSYAWHTLQRRSQITYLSSPDRAAIPSLVSGDR